jgi:hypothetical protein
MLKRAVGTAAIQCSAVEAVSFSIRGGSRTLSAAMNSLNSLPSLLLSF